MAQENSSVKIFILGKEGLPDDLRQKPVAIIVLVCYSAISEQDQAAHKENVVSLLDYFKLTNCTLKCCCMVFPSSVEPLVKRGLCSLVQQALTPRVVQEFSYLDAAYWAATQSRIIRDGLTFGGEGEIFVVCANNCESSLKTACRAQHIVVGEVPIEDLELTLPEVITK